jgi:hypothetical protein
MSPISLDQELAKKLNQGMRSGDAVELPFPIIYIWALNGQTSYKSLGGALYYGGWACKADDVQTVAEQQGLSVPRDWKRVTIASRDGDEYEAYTTRHVLVAPIGKRESWLHDGQRSATYIEGGRRHLQVLAYMAETRGENGTRQHIPWGPVVLTAKGYQARNLLDAFARWEKATAPVRRKAAPGIPAWCFYLALGTFEKERQSLNVGKPGAQSPITPVSVYVPDNLGEDTLTNLFVGSEVAAIMADLQDQAGEWLNAWKQDSLAGEEFQEAALLPEEEILF